MKYFFHWLNDGNDSIVKAGIAHLWFVIIHPFDDGNGRIARAIGNYILSKEAKEAIKFYSLSGIILEDKRRYYDVLEATTSDGLNITTWLTTHISKQ